MKKKTFDGILEKYGDVDGDLRNVLNTLNNTILKADLNLNKLASDNNDIQNTNRQANSTLPNLLENAKIIQNEMKNMSPNSRNCLEEITDANKTANVSKNEFS
ncbi:hypothetical protein NQ314_001703 [Rhamnusium bicolor]|uniref:Uncharacterized protein n=1 Tax=Rhamnusium bicolor TaxID=1586634 RepID=A0AAV8ZT40_9CUCU|nr:hypothetical protein NQ314_001703 [Rhamnusium bicolor]